MDVVRTEFQLFPWSRPMVIYGVTVYAANFMHNTHPMHGHCWQVYYPPSARICMICNQNFSSSPTKQPPDDPDTSTIIPGRGGHSTRAGRAWGAGLQWTPANPATTREIQPTASNDRYQPSSLGRCAYSVAALCSRFSDQTSSFLTSSQTGTACTCIGGYETERN